MTPGAETTYAFGDDRVAAERLALLHRVFGPTSERFVRATAPPGANVVLDLGCGPGHTTRMLGSALPAARVVGVDQSGALAGAAGDGIEILRHDVTTLPFPTPPADLVYARFLLAHLDEPERSVDRWTTLLEPGGRLLLEEVERIDARREVLARYLDTIAAVMRDEGHELYVGPRLDRLVPPAGAHVVASDVREVHPSTGEAAGMFLPNLGIWRTRPAARARADTATYDGMSEALAALVGSETRDEIVWHMRQVVIERSR
ncbi:MAG TPA: class I SAM-dependent methyltransferase [Acidimicrobiia bacterium]